MAEEKTVGPKGPNLYLLGFMGTGKSVIGRRLASRLGYEFIDSDDAIEKKHAMSIKDIFAKYGEERFRQMEREFIEGGHPSSGCVVACGGGMVCREGMPELLKSKGVCVVLFSTPEEIFELVSRNNNIHLLNVEKPFERICTMLKERTPSYMKSGIAIVADKNMAETEAHILRIYASQRKKRRK